MAVATPNLSVQNWYSDSLAAGCAAGDNTLQLNNLPTPTEGFLILDPNNVSSREVIHYTGKTSNTVTGVTRGLDGTSAQSHAQNTTVVMNYTSSFWLALQDMSAMLRGSVTPELLLANAGTSWAWTDYSATSTITGWSSFTNKIIRYIQVGKTVYVAFTLSGTSNATTASFTVPIAAKSNSNFNTEMASGLIQDNGVTQSSPARVYIDPNVNASLIVLQKAMGSAAWTASGTKDIRGLYIYETA